MSTLERGFKTWCERRAKSLREDLKLGEDEPVDVFRVAKHLGVKVLTPKDIDGMSGEDLRQLLIQDAAGWSAVTVDLPGQKLIIHNPRHSRGRQASDVAHELAHVLLRHEGLPHWFGGGNSSGSHMMLRSYDAKCEEEANWLGWTILLPRVALVRAREQGADESQVAAKYGVSEELVRFRLQKTGVETQLRRRKRGTFKVGGT
jgi:hypothetical protein